MANDCVALFLFLFFPRLRYIATYMSTTHSQRLTDSWSRAHIRSLPPPRPLTLWACLSAAQRMASALLLHPAYMYVHMCPCTLLATSLPSIIVPARWPHRRTCVRLVVRFCSLATRPPRPRHVWMAVVYACPARQTGTCTMAVVFEELPGQSVSQLARYAKE
ncbi:hypothetical protein BKA80DRAFT_279329 [Phyllosticta citrichinensis]